MTEDRIQFWYTLVTGLLLAAGFAMSVWRALQTVNHRKPLFWLRSTAVGVLLIVFSMAFATRYLGRQLPLDEELLDDLVVYMLETSLFLMACSYVATAVVDKYETDHVKNAVEAIEAMEESE